MADAAVTLSVEMAVVEMTAASGLSFFLFSVADAAIIHGVITDAVIMVVDATIAAANKRNFEDGCDRPFCIL